MGLCFDAQRARAPQPRSGARDRGFALVWGHGLRRLLITRHLCTWPVRTQPRLLPHPRAPTTGSEALTWTKLTGHDRATRQSPLGPRPSEEDEYVYFQSICPLLCAQAHTGDIAKAKQCSLQPTGPSMRTAGTGWGGANGSGAAWRGSAFPRGAGGWGPVTRVQPCWSHVLPAESGLPWGSCAQATPVQGLGAAPPPAPRQPGRCLHPTAGQLCCHTSKEGFGPQPPPLLGTGLASLLGIALLGILMD